MWFNFLGLVLFNVLSPRMLPKKPTAQKPRKRLRIFSLMRMGELLEKRELLAGLACLGGIARRPSPFARKVMLAVEQLEDRCVPSATVPLFDGPLISNVDPLATTNLVSTSTSPTAPTHNPFSLGPFKLVMTPAFQYATPGQEVTLLVTYSSDNPNYDVYSVAVSWGDTPQDLSGDWDESPHPTDTRMFKHTYAAAGDYLIEVYAKNGVPLPEMLVT